MWGDDMDLITTQIVDDVAVVPGPGAGRILDSGLESDYEGLHAQNRWAKYALFVYVYMCICMSRLLMFILCFNNILSISHNPTLSRRLKDTERGAISISRGAVLLGHACVGASHQPIPHQAGWDLQRAPYKKRSCLPCDTLLSSEGEYKNKYQKDSKSNKMMKKLHETDK